MNRLFQLAVFDMDGLMFDTEVCYVKAEEQICRRRGCKLTKELVCQMMGKIGAESLSVLNTNFGWQEDAAELLKERNVLFEEYLSVTDLPRPGLMGLLDFLEDKGISKVIGTSSLRRYADSLLDRYNLRSRFKAIVTGEDVKRGKPAPDLFVAAAKQGGVDPSAAFVIEDAENGLRAAKAGGFAAVVLVPHIHTHLTGTIEPDLTASSLDDPALLSFIERGISPIS